MDIIVHVMPILQSFGVAVNKCSFCVLVLCFRHKLDGEKGIEEFFHGGFHTRWWRFKWESVTYH